MTTAERREARADLKDEIEEIDADMIGVVEEIREARERLAAMKADRARLVADRNALKRVNA